LRKLFWADFASRKPRSQRFNSERLLQPPARTGNSDESDVQAEDADARDGSHDQRSEVHASDPSFS
jgi:hypothetical protein